MHTIDLTTREAITNPFPILSELQQAGPVQWNDSLRAWCILGYDAVSSAMSDPRLSSARILPFVGHLHEKDPELENLGNCIGLWMVFNDPPAHTRLRGLVNMAFTPRAVSDLRSKIQSIVDRLLDRIVLKEEIKFIADFAHPLPINVIAEILQIPVEDLPKLRDWSNDIALFVMSSRTVPDRHKRASRSVTAMTEYFSTIIEDRRKNPRHAILDNLIAAHDGTDVLTTEELVATCLLLFFAGHESTTHFLGNGIRALLQNPKQMEDFRENLNDRETVMNTLHEILRYDGPAFAVSRFAVENFEFHGAPIKTGDRVYLVIAAANRDPSIFENPDQFNIRRENARRMISFGHGVHNCLGAHLARLEAEIAIPSVISRVGNISSFQQDAEWLDTIVIRGMREMTISTAGSVKYRD